jgi:nucleoside-diphosphate-sugar epimerase
MTKFFVTGGDGFIGYHLVQELLKDPNNEVIIYDALKHFIPLTNSSWCYYQDYRIKTLKSERIKRIRGELLSKGFLKEVLEANKPDVIIHLAALPIANISDDYPEEALSDIFMIAVTLLDVVRSLSYKINRFVYISSSMVYGDFARDEQGEIVPAREDQHCNPKCIYGAMKLAGEVLVKTYHKRFKIPFVIVRPSAVYGPTDCNKRVTEIYLMNSIKGEDLILDNGGSHQLDFTYVKDLAKGIMLAATCEKALGETFNITRGEGKSIKELAEVVMKVNPYSHSKIVEKPVDVHRPNRGALDVSKAKNLLGYDPGYNLERGMQEYFDFVFNSIVRDGKI